MRLNWTPVRARKANSSVIRRAFGHEPRPIVGHNSYPHLVLKGAEQPQPRPADGGWDAV